MIEKLDGEIKEVRENSCANGSFRLPYYTVSKNGSVWSDSRTSVRNTQTARECAHTGAVEIFVFQPQHSRHVKYTYLHHHLEARILNIITRTITTQEFSRVVFPVYTVARLRRRRRRIINKPLCLSNDRPQSN